MDHGLGKCAVKRCGADAVTSGWCAGEITGRTFSLCREHANENTASPDPSWIWLKEKNAERTTVRWVLKDYADDSYLRDDDDHLEWGSKNDATRFDTIREAFATRYGYNDSVHVMRLTRRTNKTTVSLPPVGSRWSTDIGVHTATVVEHRGGKAVARWELESGGTFTMVWPGGWKPAPPTASEQIDRLATWIQDNRADAITEGAAVDVAIRIMEETVEKRPKIGSLWINKVSPGDGPYVVEVASDPGVKLQRVRLPFHIMRPSMDSFLTNWAPAVPAIGSKWTRRTLSGTHTATITGYRNSRPVAAIQYDAHSGVVDIELDWPGEWK